MKHLHTPSATRHFLFAVLSVMILMFTSSCARKISFQTSSVVPGAQGSVKLKKDNNSNYQIQVFLANLAEPGRLTPPKSNYVVWMESDNNYIKNIGQINTSSSFMSKRLTASFETVSAVKPTKIYITAEDDPGVQYPSAQIVLSTEQF
jgi:hypothetical protein